MRAFETATLGYEEWTHEVTTASDLWREGTRERMNKLFLVSVCM